MTPGSYVVNLRLRDVAGRVVAETASLRPDLPRHGAIDLGRIRFRVQSFVLSWSVTKADRLVSCQDVDASTVELTASPQVGERLLFKFPCSNRTGTTVAVPLGTYALDVRLLDSADKPLWATFAPLSFVAAANVRAVLPSISFAIQ